MSQVNLRQIEGFSYEVSDHGVVHSLPRTIIRSNGRPQTIARREIKPQWNGGHFQVRLYRGDGTPGVLYYVHHLVLEAFVEPRPSLAHKGLHWDDNPHNNHVDNLYWGTMQDNAFDRVRNGNDPNARKTYCDREHLLEGPNIAPWSPARTRVCLACNRALGVARYYNCAQDEYFIKVLADEKYALIVSEVVP